MYLKSYEIDYSYREHWQVKYSPKEALKIIKKLARHFKVMVRNVYFNKLNKGWAGHSGRVSLPKKDIPLGMIAHEVGHLLAFKNGHSGHNKKAYKYIKRVYKYSNKFIPEFYYLNYTKGNDYY